MADHANNLASKIRSNLTNSLKALGVDILTGAGTVVVCLTCRHFTLGRGCYQFTITIVLLLIVIILLVVHKYL